MSEISEQLKLVMQDLLVSQEVLASALMSCVAAIIVRLDDFVIIAATAPAEQLFGYYEGQLLGKSVQVLVPDVLREVHREHLKSYAMAPLQRTMGITATKLMGRHISGQTISVEIGLHPTAKALPGVPCVVATILRSRDGVRG